MVLRVAVAAVTMVPTTVALASAYLIHTPLIFSQDTIWLLTSSHFVGSPL